MLMIVVNWELNKRSDIVEDLFSMLYYFSNTFLSVKKEFLSILYPESSV